MAAARQPLRDNWQYMTSKQLTDFALLDQAAIDGATVLNVGCFYPIDEIMFVHRVARWVATDLGEETVRVAEAAAREALSEELFGRLAFAVADGTALPFEDGSFDVVVSMSTVDHVPEPASRQRFINEMARVTGPGGRVVITVPNRWSRGYAQRAKLDPGSAPVFYEYCFSPLEFRRMVTDAGLRISRFTSSSEVHAFAPRPVLPTIDRRPLLATWNALARYFGARMGVLAIKD
jgi:SAM-dependent methyltransferase